MRSDSQERRMAMIAHDQPYWAACARVAGMDEAGRGPLAGDVVAACVIMPSAPTVDWVDDSKKLSALRRDKVYEEILRTALYVGVGRASGQPHPDPEEHREARVEQRPPQRLPRRRRVRPARVPREIEGEQRERDDGEDGPRPGVDGHRAASSPRCP